jgi:hypothetical protein
MGEQGVNPNVNCLDGKRCPRCGSYGPFEVEVSMRVLLSDEGSDDAEDGTIDYGDDSPARCLDCNSDGKFGDFNAP